MPFDHMPTTQQLLLKSDASLKPTQCLAAAHKATHNANRMGYRKNRYVLHSGRKIINFKGGPRERTRTGELEA